MAVERVPGSSSLVDVLDRVLEKGIVVDGWARISLDGIDVLSDNARVVVCNETHQAYRASITTGALPSRMALADGWCEGERRGARSARRRS